VKAGSGTVVLADQSYGHINPHSDILAAARETILARCSHMAIWLGAVR
jgi:hypothetical protein